MRVCSKCHIEKPFDAFGKNKNAPNGVGYRCKQCMNELSKARHKANPAYHREYKRKDNYGTKQVARWTKEGGLGVYMLWNKIDKCVDRVGEGLLRTRKINYKAKNPNHPQQINDNVEKYGFDNVYDFIVLHKCETKEECQRLETIEINKLQPRYNTEKIEQ